MNVISKDLTQRSLEKMGGAMISHNIVSVPFINVQFDLLSDTECALGDLDLMGKLSCNNFLYIKHLCFAAYGSDNALIAYLSAAFSIERCFTANHIDLTAYTCIFNKLIISSKVFDLTFAIERIITCESGRKSLIHFMENSFVCTHIFRAASCSSCSFSLFIHAGIVAFFINGHTLFFKYLSCKVYWETVGIGKFEAAFSIKHFLSV